eukprot:TRINITY_DN5911_c0_g1_i1.p1 TRINITY_DN5911_c0_g1~~TRINITY_DN5911_c0_g1_i1.p1  ORF type:complete len:1031 (+),score=207.98 TRINITY_DN5911_c0_g1_i1:58-3093(+)
MVCCERTNRGAGDFGERFFHALWRPLVKRCVFPSDTALQRRQKELLIPIWAITIFLSSLCTLWFGVGSTVGSTTLTPPMIVTGTVFSAASLALIIWTMRGGRMSDRQVNMTCFGGTVMAILMDLFAGGIFDGWMMSLFFVMVHTSCISPEGLSEGMLQCGVGWLMKAVVHMWLLLQFLGDVLDVNIYSWVPATNFPSRPQLEPDVSAWRSIMGIIIVSLTSVIGRQAARSLHDERQKQQAAVELAKKVAQAMARFDLAEAEQYVSPADVSLGGTPLRPNSEALSSCPELAAAFARLLSNLRRYRPFLPDALFVSSEHIEIDNAVRVDLDTLTPHTRESSTVGQDMSADSPLSPVGSGDSVSRSVSASRSMALGLRHRTVALLSAQMDFGACAAMESAPLEIGGRFVASVLGCVRTAQGVVQQFDVHGVFVSFGARGEAPDDAARACGCAINIRDVVAPMCSKCPSGRGPRLGVAVSWGTCIVGSVGDSDKRAFQIVGRPADLAKALAPLSVRAMPAGENGAVCDADTAQRAEGQGIAVSRLGPTPDGAGPEWAAGGRWEGTELYQIMDDSKCPAAMLRKEAAELERLPEHLRILLDELQAPRTIPQGRAPHRRGWVELASGDFGRVFAAHLRSLGDDVAVKELRDTGTGHGDALSKRVNFLREMRNLHETPVNQVLRFYGWAPGTQGELYMVTEMCANGALPRWLGGNLSPSARGRLALLVAVSVGRAVAYFHSVGKVHMDIAARNVLVTAAGELRLGDLGLLTSAGSPAPVIAVCWSPPESVAARAARRQAEKPHDLWSFGCLLYEVLSGARPWHHVRPSSNARNDGHALLRAVARKLSDGELPFPPGEPPGAVEADNVCARLWSHTVLPLWSRDPADRPAMRDVVDRALQLRGDGGDSVSGIFSVAPRVEDPPKPKWGIDAVLGRKRAGTRAAAPPATGRKTPPRTDTGGLARSRTAATEAALTARSRTAATEAALTAAPEEEGNEMSDYFEGSEYFAIRNEQRVAVAK